MVLYKRVRRIFRQNLLKYLSVLIIVILGMAVVVGYGNTSFTTEKTMDQYWQRTNIEDGEFTTYAELTDSNMNEIKNKGFNVQKTFYFDIHEGDTTYRVFKERKSIDLEDVQKGSKKSPDNNEVQVEEMYLSDHNLSIRDNLKIGGSAYKIISSVTVPDYCHRVAEISDVGTDENFALVFVNSTEYDDLLAKTASKEVYNYTYTVKRGDLDEQNDGLYKYLLDLPVSKDNIKDTYILSKIQNIDSAKDNLRSGFNALKDEASQLRQSLSKLQYVIASTRGLTGFSQTSSSLLQGSADLSGGISDMQKNVEELADESLTWKYPNLYTFNIAKTNSRITDFVSAHQMYRTLALIIGIVIAVLIAYIMTLMASGVIKNDRKVIGTLYAIGYRRKEIRKIYLIIPAIVVTVGSVAGTILGFKITGLCITANYSHPKIVETYPPVLLLYGIVLPIIITLVINFAVINRKLKLSALDIISGRTAQTAPKHIPKTKGKEKSFIRAFRRSQFRKEAAGHAGLLFGASLAILIMILGVSLYDSTEYYANSVDYDLHFKYMYTLTNPLEKNISGTEKAYTRQFDMYCPMAGKDMPVVIQGIEKGSKYFSFADNLTGDKNKIYMSDSALVKFNYKVGDKIIFTDSLNKKNYVFTVAGTVRYKNGIYFFMNIDSMRKHFGVDDDYYNTLMSGKKLDIDQNMLLSTLTKKSVIDTANSWVKDTMIPIGMFLVMSIVIFVLVMYLITKNILEHATYQISMLKIIGYRNRELNKMYLNSSLITVIFSIIIMFPLGTYLMKSIIPLVNATMQSGMKSYISLKSYVFMAVMVLLSYLLSYALMQRKIAKIDPNEVLKSRG